MATAPVTPMWTLESRWFDVAVFSALSVVLTVIFGRFEEHKPAWRRLAKLALFLAILLVLIEVAGRAWAYGTIGVLLAAGGTVHFVVLSRLGINGWSGEPREKFAALLREIELRGEVRTLLSVARPRRRSSP